MCDNDSYDRRKVIWVSAVIFKRDVEDERYRKKNLFAQFRIELFHQLYKISIQYQYQL